MLFEIRVIEDKSRKRKKKSKEIKRIMKAEIAKIAFISGKFKIPLANYDFLSFKKDGTVSVTSFDGSSLDVPSSQITYKLKKIK